MAGALRRSGLSIRRRLFEASRAQFCRAGQRAPGTRARSARPFWSAGTCGGPLWAGLCLPLLANLIQAFAPLRLAVCSIVRIGPAAPDVPPGAVDAGSPLTLSNFDEAFSQVSIRQEVTEIQHPPSLYARVMGERFAPLPRAVRAMHDVFRDGGASGRAVVTRGRGLVARLAAGAGGCRRKESKRCTCPSPRRTGSRPGPAISAGVSSGAACRGAGHIWWSGSVRSALPSTCRAARKGSRW